MQRTPVVSSQITSVGYDPVTLTLEIEFPSRKEGPRGIAVGIGSVYQYANVPSDVHQALIASESVGKYFGANIRGKFEYRKMPLAEADAQP